ncbi:splicing regulator SDE2 [Cynoglossus semilaevis]|uniref:splicing regulator SDE2 n=1 Tax=Cynoglossus semilaevis TaxID=244447 RepID=UPI0007DC8515|nr:replication stress response regulator SDE2 [Cynoglossus semilaevis]
MEVYVKSPNFRRFSLFPEGSLVGDVLANLVQLQGIPPEDFYILRNGRRADLNDPVQNGATYHLQPRLCGGKGGFGSMLRALGAQIEKTTNREACRDLSGRRLRDVNHEKEMADWLKKQAEREAEKEQRRTERLQRKLAEPKHRFSDVQYQEQCYDLSQRVEESVIKGLQASSSGQVKADTVSATKRTNSDDSEQTTRKKMVAADYWTGLEGFSSEDEDVESEEESSPSTSSSSCGAAAKVEQREEAEPQQSCRSSPAESSSSEDQGPTNISTSEVQDQSSTNSSEDQDNAAETPAEPKTSEDQECTAMCRISEDQNADDTRTSEVQSPAETNQPQEQIGATESKTMKDSDPVAQSEQQSAVDLDSVSSVQQLEALGLDILKKELMSRGLKCGGTLSERAARLHSIRGLRPDQIDPSLFAKSGKSKKK